MCKAFLFLSLAVSATGCSTTTNLNNQLVLSKVKGDYDDDGLSDVASLESSSGSKAELIVDLSSQGRVIVDSVGYSADMQISTLPSGTYERSCIQGYGVDCQAIGNTIATSADGIKLVYPEKASHLYYWDGRIFQKINLTD